MSDFYGTVEGIEHAGTEHRDTDPLEAMLAQLRVLGIRYTIKPWSAGGLEVRLELAGEHPQFFSPPVGGRGRFTGVTLGHKKEQILFAISSALSILLSQIIRSNENFGHGFMRYWKENTGGEWGGCAPPAAPARPSARPERKTRPVPHPEGQDDSGGGLG
jgi:hypothetical protein